MHTFLTLVSFAFVLGQSKRVLDRYQHAGLNLPQHVVFLFSILQVKSTNEVDLENPSPGIKLEVLLFRPA
jgi:hypothetical protein